MSTRCVINFSDGTTVEAKVYRHSDGYPDGKHGVLADLKRFFAAVEKDTRDRRFNGPCYLAAKYVVWQAGEYAKTTCRRTRTYEDGAWKKSAPLNFLGVGILMSDPEDIEYVYTVDCSKLQGLKKRPAVHHRGAHVEPLEAVAHDAIIAGG